MIHRRGLRVFFVYGFLHNIFARLCVTLPSSLRVARRAEAHASARAPEESLCRGAGRRRKLMLTGFISLQVQYSHLHWCIYPELQASVCLFSSQVSGLWRTLKIYAKRAFMWCAIRWGKQKSLAIWTRVSRSLLSFSRKLHSELQKRTHRTLL